LIGTEGQLGVIPANEAELFVILSPVGPYFSSGIKPINLVRYFLISSQTERPTRKLRIDKNTFKNICKFSGLHRLSKVTS